MKSQENQVLLFSVELQSLRKYLFQYYTSIAHTFEGEAKEKLNNYFFQINSISQTEMANHTNRALAEVLIKSDAKQPNQRKFSYEMKKESDIPSIREFNEGNFGRRSSQEISEEDSEQQLSPADDFWETPIDWEHESIQVDNAPFTLMEQTPLAKIHFLFTMLNVSKIFVINEGFMVGIITKNEFLRRRVLEEEHEESSSLT